MRDSVHILQTILTLFTKHKRYMTCEYEEVQLFVSGGQRGRTTARGLRGRAREPAATRGHAEHSEIRLLCSEAADKMPRPEPPSGAARVPEMPLAHEMMGVFGFRVSDSRCCKLRSVRMRAGELSHTQAPSRSRMRGETAAPLFSARAGRASLLQRGGRVAVGAGAGGKGLRALHDTGSEAGRWARAARREASAACCKAGRARP